MRSFFAHRTFKNNLPRLPRTFLLPFLALCAALFATGCTSIRKNYPQTPSYTLAPPTAADSTATQRIDAQLARHPDGYSGFRLLALSSEALAARLALADQATRSLDVQYYMIHNDPTGSLILQHILAAADRGVRVRILLDDIHVVGNDRDVLALNAHPNIQVRLFNPFKSRQGFGLAIFTQYLLDGRRLNRRMHNKSFIADSHIAVIGGRNIGDEYFDARQDVNFRDLDVLAIGPIVKQITDSFDTFWNDTAAYPLAAFYHRAEYRHTLDQFRATLQKNARALAPTSTAQRLLSRPDFPFDDDPVPPPAVSAPATASTPAPATPATGQTATTLQPFSPSALQPFPPRPPSPFYWRWGAAELIADTPEKINPEEDKNALKRGPHIGDTLASIIDTTRESFLLISPYFVPRPQGVELLAGLVARDARVQVLTNSLASTDVPLVHAGYSRYRPALLKAGIELYELQALPSQTSKRFFRGRRNAGISLHAKAFVIDNRITFIGSMNIDPRSELLNTEMGVLVDSVELARDVAAFFHEAIAPDSSYRVHLAPSDSNSNKKLYWTGSPNDSSEATSSTIPATLTRDPNTSLWLRAKINILGLLPIEGLL